MLKNGSFNFNPEKKTLNKVLIFDINKTKEEQIMHEFIGLPKADNEFFIENKAGTNVFMLKKEN